MLANNRVPHPHSACPKPEEEVVETGLKPRERSCGKESPNKSYAFIEESKQPGTQ